MYGIECQNEQCRHLDRKPEQTIPHRLPFGGVYLEQSQRSQDRPCLTLRENTERPVTEGTNRIVGNDPERIVTEALAVLNGKAGRVPELWDSQAAERIVAVLRKRTCQRS